MPQAGSLIYHNMHKSSVEILKVLCSYVHCSLSTGLFENKNWFTTYTWTINEERRFQSFLYKYIQNDQYYYELTKDFPEAKADSKVEFVKKFTLFYGWDLEEMINKMKEHTQSKETKELQPS